MKRYPKFHSILFFIVALFCFLLSEVYFLSNPMFYKSDFIDLYHGPIILYLLWLSAIGPFGMDYVTVIDEATGKVYSGMTYTTSVGTRFLQVPPLNYHSFVGIKID